MDLFDRDGREGRADASFELRFSPDVALVPIVRRFASDFCSRVVGNADVTSRLAVATHELLENAIRYTSDRQSVIRVAVERDTVAVRVVIATKNRADEARTTELRALLAEMRESRDRAVFYQTIMRRSAKRASGSGLGLARIYAESEMDVLGRFESGEVHLRAEGLYLVAGGGGAA